MDVDSQLLTVTDANMNAKLLLLTMFFQMFRHLMAVRPDLVITTGAAPGFAALTLGRMLGAKVIWIDSIANSEEMSSSGKQAGRFAHLWLTQWQHLSRPEGPHYFGAVL